MTDSSVGTFRVPIECAGHPAGPFRRVQALVDTGATYTWLPGDLLEALGVTAGEERAFVLADGRERRYGIGWIHVRVAGKHPQPTIAVFGEPGSDPLLGAFTLEGFGLAADPVNRRLVPVPGLLKVGVPGLGLVRSPSRGRVGVAPGLKPGLGMCAL